MTQPDYYPPRKKRRWPWILGGAAALVLLLCGGLVLAAAVGGSKGGTGAAATTSAPQTGMPIQTPNKVIPFEPLPTTPAAPAKPAAATIDDGTWVVGEDVPAGTYKVTAPVESGCYWAITKSGTNGDTIISNDLPSGGRPKVTIKKGQDFDTERCGTWQKVG